jgi:hypothetical protein
MGLGIVELFLERKAKWNFTEDVLSVYRARGTNRSFVGGGKILREMLGTLPGRKSRHCPTRSYRLVNTALYMKNFFATELKLDKTKLCLIRHPTQFTNRGKATLRTHLIV